MKKHLLRSVALGTCLTALSMTGCQLAENQLKIDRDNNLEFQDIRDSMAPREIPADAVTAKADGVPDFQDYTAMTAKDLKPMPLVTVSVNESIPLKDVLYELAQQANYDVELDPRIQGAIIFTARNRPFDEVMERIADLASLRYKFVNNVVRVELDTPYSETYKIDYLAAVRSTTSTVENNVTVSGGDSGSASTGSAFKLSGSTEIDFWKELDSNIKQILESNSPENALRTKATPTVTVAPVAQDPNSPPAAPTDTSASATTSKFGQVPATDDANAAPAVDVKATTTPADPTTSAESTSELVPTYSINRQAGLLSVYANERVQKKIKSYLDDLRASVGAQVLIEAKVFQVDLNDEFATGINWSALAKSGGEFSIAYNSGSPPLPGLDPASSAALTLGYTGNDLSTIISAVSRFGTVHALASPRLTVVNNQSAVLNVAKNTTYFELDITTSQNQSQSTTTVNSTAKSVPEGVLVNVTPAIDIANKEVTMTIRPTISRIDGFVNDPGVAFVIAQSNLTSSQAAGLQSRVPNVTVQEFDSVMKVKSGEVMVMGGLLKDRTESEQNGVPVLSETPIFGGLFRKQADKVSKSEIVVFLRATIVDTGAQTIHQTDRDLYKLYSQDRRPFPL